MINSYFGSIGLIEGTRGLFDLRARVDLLIVRDNETISLEVYANHKGNQHFLLIQENFPNTNFFMGEAS